MKTKLLLLTAIYCVIGQLYAQIPSNDLIENAIEITENNFTDENLRLDIATPNGIGGSDCGVDSFPRVYYKFTATGNANVTANLTDSNFQQINSNSFIIPYLAPNLNVTDESELTVLPGFCSFNLGLNFNINAGQSYYIQVCRNLDINQLTNVNINIPQESSQADRNALIAFYNATDGVNWNNNTNWNTNFAVGSWHGVTVENGRVVRLELPSNNIIGNLDELTALDALTFIDLRLNEMGGTIPDFSTINTLEELIIDNNNFSFADLEANFNQNTVLTNFDFNPQRVTESLLNIEATIGDDYDLAMTAIPGTNVSYQWYKRTGSIIAEAEAIPGATSNIYTITNTQVEDLNIYYCVANSAIIPDFTIQREDINLTAPVSQIERDALVAIYNATDGPNWADNTNWLSTAPVREWVGVNVIGNRVTSLNLFGTGLNGTLPDEIGDLANLEILNISLNESLVGPIPSSIGNLTQLKNLSLQGNGHTGSIPSTIGNMTALETIRLLWNDLSGTIPSSIGNLTNLVTLVLDGTNGNSLEGPLPPELLNLTNLNLLSLGNNELTGELPNFSVLPNLDVLTIQGNKFSFADLALNQTNNLNIPNYIFSPQRNDSVEEFLDVNAGCDITFDAEEATVLEIVSSIPDDNNYLWYQDGNPLNFATASKYSIPNIQIFQSGVFYCEITNPTVENLIIRRENVTINVVFEDAIQADKDALIAFYNANNGIDWATSTNWNTTEPVGSWHGITVKNGRVTSINLRGNNIVGSDFSNLLNLDKLKFIDFNSNRLNGIVPNFSMLPDLKFLSLSNNMFSFADLEPNLTQNNTITQFNYQTQNSLDEEQQIEGIIGSEIDLTMTPIAGTNVQYQWYRANRFTQGVTDNPVVGATNSTLTFTNLQESNLDTYVCYATSASIPDLTIIRPRIDLFGEVSQEDRNALMAFYNAFDGDNWTDNTNWGTTAPVRDWFSVTTAGNRVIGINFFGENNLVGQIPTEIENLIHLEFLGLAVNTGITGPLPTSIGNLSQLKRLRLQGTGNSGSLPASIGNLSKLEELRLLGTNFSGELPSSIGNLINLKDITINGTVFFGNGNNFAGQLPPSIGNMTSLERFDAGLNNFEGTIPVEFTNLSNLTFIGLASNELSGEVPNFGNLPNLEGFLIEDNTFSFADLEPNQANNLTIPFYQFSPQRNSSIPETIEVPPGQSITLDVNGMTTSTRFFRLLNTDQYQWFKDNEAISGATESTYTINNPQPDDSGVYYCEITNTTVDGLVVTRAEITLNVNAALSIDDNEITELKVYPNPATNWVNITRNGLQDANIEVYDINGRLIIKQGITSNTHSFNIETLNTGTYIIRITNSENKTVTKRFIKK